MEAAVAPPLLRLHGISPAIAAELAALPDSHEESDAGITRGLAARGETPRDTESGEAPA